jgi:hypothetical protein
MQAAGVMPENKRHVNRLQMTPLLLKKNTTSIVRV